MPHLQHLILALLVTLSLSQNLFDISPWYTIELQTMRGVLVKMASGESNVIVALNNGTVIISDFYGNVSPLPTGNTNNIIQIDSFPNYVMALDSGNNLYVWNTTGSGSMILSQNFPSSVSNVAWRQASNSTLIVSVNFGFNIIEYQLLSGSLVPTNIVYSISGATIATAIYSGDGNWLVVGTNNSQVNAFNTSTGNVQPSAIPTSSPIQKFSLLNNNQNIVGLTNNYMMVWISTENFTYANLTTIPSTSAFSGCPSSLIVSGLASSSSMNVYLQNGNFLQGLNYPTNTVTSLDCSQNYLVSLDTSGNVAINPYSDISLSKLVGWVIAVIVVGAVLFLVGVGLCIWCCCRRRNLTLQVSLNTTGKELTVTDNVSYKQQMY